MPFIVGARATAADAPAATAADLEFFEREVRPVLAESCFQCHGPDQRKSNLRLDHIDFARQGGERGPALVPGDAMSSRLVEAINYNNPKLEMPPKSKLPQAKIDVLTDWIRRGAPWPNEPKPKAGKGGASFDLESRKGEHWSWRPIAKVSPPDVRRADWPASPIDRFILARLEAKGLQPAPDADRRTLIRRVALDLTGIPPTPEEVEAFVNDKSPDAYEKVVDRLLTSPRFGERWARHWLDLVRYAESFGHEFDYSIREPWRYRDYVIRAINADVGYDQFVREHIAGDLIEKPRRHPTEDYNESIIGTGFWFLHEQTHAPTDVRQHEADRIDNQIDVVSKSFLGLTVACARCHDHKFDAISAADYYAMAGYLQSSREQIAYLDPGRRIETIVKELQKQKAEADKALATFARKTDQPKPIVHEQSELVGDFSDGTYDGWFTAGWAWGDAPTRAGQWDRLSNAAKPVQPGVAHSGLLSEELTGTLRSPEFDLKHKQIAIRAFGKGQIRLIVDSYTMIKHSGLLFGGFKINVDTKGKWQWIRIGGDLKLYNKTGNHRAHLEIIDDDPNAYLMIDEVRLTDGPLPEPAPFKAKSVLESEDAQFAARAKRMADIASKTPGPMRVLSIADGTGEDSYVHVRGAWHEKGKATPRRFLAALGGDEQPQLEPSDGSGRLQLAEAMLADDNPFAARVAVNRVWHHLLGRGIVPTVDNFGVLGQPPSHPQLLDYLAERFRTDLNWSRKALIRDIVLSRTYRMSSKPYDTAAEEKDAGNILLHRARVRRMEGEIIRDSILAVSGRLDTNMYGGPVPVHLTPFMEGRGRPGSGPIDGNGRRSIYLSVRRNFLAPMFLAFDTPQPFSTVGRRDVTNVPAQALILMNDPFVVGQARVWAKRVIKDCPEPGERVDRMYREAFGRPPTDAERTRALTFIKSQAAIHGLKPDAAQNHEQVWTDFAHVLFNVKEFVLVN